MGRADWCALRGQITPQREISSAVATGLAFLLWFGSAGCVNLPRVDLTEGTTPAELSAHVRFLAQPKLKGRKPETRGSRLARDYIESRFAAYGLVPWGSESNYSLSFGYGNNVVGVLPGTDKTLAPEIVLLSAHYDHLGKQKGSIYPGASDNASGVAALLATAKEMSRNRSKRTVAFAAFDCEEWMLLGSFAFSCRADVTNAKIVGVVNVDMLGRDFLDAVKNTLFVSGTEGYPTLRDRISQFGTNANIRVLALGSDLVGPRGDHVAFESMGIPCLFFSCGTGRDYHAPTDTPDTLDYPAIERSARVISKTVRELAENEDKFASNGSDFDTEELRTVKTVLSEVAEQASAKVKNVENARKPLHAALEPRKSDIAQFQVLADEADDLLSRGRYDQNARERLVLDATGILSPYLLPVGDLAKASTAEEKEQQVGMQFLQWFYLNYRREIMEGYRKLVSQLLKYRPGPFRTMPKFEHEVYEIADSDIRMAEAEGGIWSLNALSSRFTFKAGSVSTKWLIKSFAADISVGADGIDCEGTREQIADFCLLRLRAERTNSLHFEQVRKVLEIARGKHSKGDYRELLEERLEHGHFRDETEWIVNCLASGSTELTMEAIGAAADSKDKRVRKALNGIIVDRNVRSDVRAAAIRSPGKVERNELRAVLDDASPVYRLEYTPRLRKEYPFAERPTVKLLKPIIAKQMQHSPDASKTIGDLAREQLKKTS